MLELVKIPDEFLKQTCRALSDEEVKSGAADGLNLLEFSRNLAEAMKHYRGIGLAAPQVRVGLRAFAINTDKKALIVFNPIVSELEGSQLSDEGCLSIPGVSGTVRRARSLRLQGVGPTGLKIDTKISGIFACVVQHENDHLDGILFTEKAIKGSITNANQ